MTLRRLSLRQLASAVVGLVLVSGAGAWRARRLSGAAAARWSGLREGAEASAGLSPSQALQLQARRAVRGWLQAAADDAGGGGGEPPPWP